MHASVSVAGASASAARITPPPAAALGWLLTGVNVRERVNWNKCAKIEERSEGLSAAVVLATVLSIRESRRCNGVRKKQSWRTGGDYGV